MPISPKKPIPTVQEQFAAAIRTSDEMAKHMTYSEKMDLFRRNSEIGTRAHRLDQKKRATKTET